MALSKLESLQRAIKIIYGCKTTYGCDMTEHTKSEREAKLEIERRTMKIDPIHRLIRAAFEDPSFFVQLTPSLLWAHLKEKIESLDSLVYKAKFNADLQEDLAVFRKDLALAQGVLYSAKVHLEDYLRKNRNIKPVA